MNSPEYLNLSCIDSFKIEGVKDELVISVCDALKRKWWIDNNTNVNLPGMARYYKADKAVLLKIIKWYESNLMDTTFTIIDDEAPHSQN